MTEAVFTFRDEFSVARPTAVETAPVEPVFEGNNDIWLEKLPLELRYRIRIDEPMSAHTTYKVGGPADYFFAARSVDDCRHILAAVEAVEIPMIVAGLGSNMLVSDRGFRGLILNIGADWTGIEKLNIEQVAKRYGLSADKIRAELELLGRGDYPGDLGSDPVFLIAQAGTPLVDVAAFARARDLAGLEFACGIPGSVGGAAIMNAGAYGGSIEQTALFSVSLNRKGELYLTGAGDRPFFYRSSHFKNAGAIVTEVAFVVRPGDPELIRSRTENFTQRRNRSQPLDLPSAGSVFKRPRNDCYVGPMIDNCGLKGLRVGDAQVSEKHANFIVNVGAATAADIRSLIAMVKKRVFEEYGEVLEPEICFIGDFDAE